MRCRYPQADRRYDERLVSLRKEQDDHEQTLSAIARSDVAGVASAHPGDGQTIAREMPSQSCVARSLTQERLAGLLKVNQAAISKLESRTDMDISTLRSYIEAMGGDLDIVARFPEGDVHIQKFHQEEANGAEA